VLEVFELEENLSVSLIAQHRRQPALGTADVCLDPLQCMFDVFLHRGNVPESRYEWKSGLTIVFIEQSAAC
jgi:hypothetical protein